MFLIERSTYVLVGIFLTIVYGTFSGQVTFEGDFVANVAGATIGGFISVTLAILMFNHERKVAAADAAEKDVQDREESIRQALRHIRGIRESIEVGLSITINNSERTIDEIVYSIRIADQFYHRGESTDIHLRFATMEAIQVGNDVPNRLFTAVSQSGENDANVVVPAADLICRSAIEKIDIIMNDYARIRKYPAL